MHDNGRKKIEIETKHNFFLDLIFVFENKARLVKKKINLK